MPAALACTGSPAGSCFGRDRWANHQGRAAASPAQTGSACTRGLSVRRGSCSRGGGPPSPCRLQQQQDGGKTRGQLALMSELSREAQVVTWDKARAGDGAGLGKWAGGSGSRCWVAQDCGTRSTGPAWPNKSAAGGSAWWRAPACLAGPACPTLCSPRAGSAPLSRALWLTVAGGAQHVEFLGGAVRGRPRCTQLAAVDQEQAVARARQGALHGATT